MSGALPIEGRRALVVGLGRSGRAAARHLLAGGAAEVRASERLERDALGEEALALEKRGVHLHLGGHRAEDLAGIDLVVLSPGVRPSALPGLEEARGRGVEVLSEIDLVADALGPRTIAITGTNGKSTTVAMCAAILARAGRGGVLSGNYGTPLVEAAFGDEGTRWYALEISSFQLATTTRLRAAAGALLNVEPDHLDWHGSFAAYREAKERIALLRAESAPLVAVIDDPIADALARSAAPPALRVSARARVAEGGFAAEGALWLTKDGEARRLMPRDALPLPGRHNETNALVAAVAAAACGVDDAAIADALAGFEALEHRMQPVAEREGVRFVDDSKATNVASALEAIAAFAGGAGRLFVLLGGRDKDSDFRPLAGALTRAGARAICFGEAGPRIAEVLRAEGFEELAQAGGLTDAVARAHREVRRGDVVLLSPACASFDEFSGYAERGRVFAELAAGARP